MLPRCRIPSIVVTTQDGPSRIAELRALLHQANDAYYQQADPIMPDRTYDELMAELADLEAAHPALDDPHSPTRRVGGGLIEGFETVEHLVPMQSIDNAYDTEAIVVWLERITAQLDGEQPAVFADPKIDGVAMSIHYRDGQLELAVTRGDGVRGDDITAQARRMLSVPLRLAEAVTVEVRGEAVIPNDAFAEVNAQRAAADEPLFKNARNTTAGTLKSLNTDLVAQRQVQFIMHSRGAGDDLGAATWGEFCSAAATLGLPVSDLGRRFTSTDDLLAHLEAFAATRHTLDVGIDGMVVRVDRFDLQHELGATAKAHAGASPSNTPRSRCRAHYWR